MAKGQRDIVKLLYNDNLEYERLKVWWLQKQRQIGCRCHCSAKAHKEFNIDFTTIANAIIGYIEHLEDVPKLPTAYKARIEAYK